MNSLSEYLPCIHRLPPSLSAVDVFRRLADKPHCVFLDSALRHGRLGRFSYVAADPFDVVNVATDGSNAIETLRARMAQYAQTNAPDLPSFQGGAAGLFGYELNLSLEELPRANWDEFSLPSLAVGLFDVVVAFDHQETDAWLISQGFPETNPARRVMRAEARAEQFLQWLSGKPADLVAFDRGRIELAAPIVDTQHPQVFSNFCRDDYQAAVASAIEYIRRGDIFQVNLSQRLVSPATDHAANLYCHLRDRTPATFSGYFDSGDFQVVSVSPERFLRVDGRRVETRPIKGTRPRVDRPEADLYSADALRADAKERAENVMIVDLQRNDLSRVCQPDTVQVTQLCRLENYGYVQHLVSAVEATLREDCDTFDLIRAAFPGGSVTGAPKVRAMEIITELEQTARGAYCGSLGYIGWDGTADLNILIRTVTVAGGWLQLPVGGGITVRSDPKREYQETWHKAAGMLRVVG